MDGFRRTAMLRFAVTPVFWVLLSLASLECSIFTRGSAGKTSPDKRAPKEEAPLKVGTPLSRPSDEQRGLPANSNTAEEYVHLASKALAAGKWKEAAAAIQALIRNFGDHPEAEPIIARYQPALAVCLIRLERYEEALEPIQIAIRTPNRAPSIVLDLYFQKALCEFKIRRFSHARESLAHFLILSPVDRRYYEAQLQVAKCFLFENNPSAAAEHLQKIRPVLDPVYTLEALVLELRSLIEADQPDGALKLYQTQQKGFSEATDAISLNALLLQLGSGLLERSRFREAILCLGRVRSFQSLVALQHNRLKSYEKQMSKLDFTTDPKLRQSLILASDRLTLELEAFHDNTGYDALVRIRLASAYQALGRSREAALVLEQAISRLPPDSSLEGVGITLSQLWCELECWPKVEETYSLFKSKFPKSPVLPALSYLKGIAQQKQNLNTEARSTFEAIQKEYPKTDWALRAEFMTAFVELLAGDSESAATRFQKFADKHPLHELSEEAESWHCIGFGIAKKHPLCLTAANRYLKRYPDGPHRGTVLFQQARSFIGNRDYSKGVEVLRSFLAEYPDHPNRGEAVLLLSEALEALDSYQSALDVCLTLNTSKTTAFEMIWFTAAKLLQRLERTEEMEDHLEQFAAINPQSPQFAEAVLLTQKIVSRKNPQPDQESLLWLTLCRYGDDPENLAVEPLLQSLVKHRDEGSLKTGPLNRLWQELESATSRGLSVWSNRLRWALHLAMSREDPEQSIQILEEAMKAAPLEDTSDTLLSAFAEHCKTISNAEGAEIYWRALLKWTPSSSRKDQALLELIIASVNRSESDVSASLIKRFERECTSSSLTGNVNLQKARLQKASSQTATAKLTLEAVLSNKQVRGDIKAEALLLLADWHMEQKQPKLAIPYYQRVYVMYGRWKQSVAKAYLRSAEAFELLGDKAAAQRTYKEMLQADLPVRCPELIIAEERLICLGRDQ